MKNIDYSFVTFSDNQSIENNINCIHSRNLYVIIDGVGRDYLVEKAAKLASETILNTFFNILEENNSPGDAIFYSINNANRAILEERIKINEKMAASVCIVYLQDKIMYFSHLGDSRVYSFQENELNQLTRDHTLREEDPFAEKRYDDPRALQALIKGLGIHEKADVYVKKYPLEKKGMVILTTERLTERISNRDIQWLSRKINNPRKFIKGVIDLYKRKGGDEAFTLGLISYGGIPKWFRKVLSVYLVFFVVLLLVIGGYFMIFTGDTVPPVEITETFVPAAVEDEEKDMESNAVKAETVSTPSEIEEKTVETVAEYENKSIVRKQILAERPDIPEIEEISIEGEQAAVEDFYQDINTFLADWKKAWEMSAGKDGNFNEYISFYSENFKSGRLDFEGWKSDKSRKNKRKKWIKVEISDIKISGPDLNNTVDVRFTQTYKSSNFSVISDKALLLKKENSKWVIVSEISN